MKRHVGYSVKVSVYFDEWHWRPFKLKHCPVVQWLCFYLVWERIEE